MNDSNINKPPGKKNKTSEELVKVQNELKRTYENFLYIFDNAPIGYITLDNSGLIKAANKFTFNILKLSKYDLLEKSFSGFVHKESNKLFFDTTKKSIKSGKNQRCELKLQNSIGEPFYAEVTISSVLDSKKKISESKIAFVDITPQKEAEKKLVLIDRRLEEQINTRTQELIESNKMLEEARDKAEDLNLMKSFFLANMSHELRTPMVGILGFSEVIMSETKDPDIKEMASLIHNGGTRLLETLNLILDFSKIESEKINLNYEITNVNETVKDVVNIFSDTIQKKNLVIKFTSIENEIKATVDTRLFKQIIINLVNNAVKYTNEGYIEVSLLTYEEKLILKVRDTGIGIDKDKIGIIFEEFRQVSEGLNRQFSGTGLGLTLTKRFIELMNGSIRVISELNKGTEFIVELPLEPEETSNISINIFLPGMKALIVEDDEISYSLLKNIINDLCEAHIATNLEDAMNKASEHLYDFVIMDINLGGDDTGIDVTRELRTLDGYSNVPIIAVTAYAMKGDKKFFVNSGLDAYVSKPFTRNELIMTIKRCLNTISG
jgi:PAS domain S-box-containing protein